MGTARHTQQEPSYGLSVLHSLFFIPSNAERP